MSELKTAYQVDELESNGMVPGHLVQPIIAIVEEVKAAANEVVRTSREEHTARADERLKRAYAERRIIREAGGDEKALGSNEDARKRAFIIGLADDEIYMEARTALETATNNHELATTRLENAQLDYDVALMRAGLWRA